MHGEIFRTPQGADFAYLQPDVFARVNVSRGLPSPMIASYNEWASPLNPPPFRSADPIEHHRSLNELLTALMPPRIRYLRRTLKYSDQRLRALCAPSRPWKRPHACRHCSIRVRASWTSAVDAIKMSYQNSDSTETSCENFEVIYGISKTSTKDSSTRMRWRAR